MFTLTTFFVLAYLKRLPEDAEDRSDSESKSVVYHCTVAVQQLQRLESTMRVGQLWWLIDKIQIS